MNQQQPNPNKDQNTQSGKATTPREANIPSRTGAWDDAEVEQKESPDSSKKSLSNPADQIRENRNKGGLGFRKSERLANENFADASDSDLASADEEIERSKDSMRGSQMRASPKGDRPQDQNPEEEFTSDDREDMPQSHPRRSESGKEKDLKFSGRV